MMTRLKIPLILFVALFVAGCASLDRAAEKTKQATTQPVTQAVAAAFPMGELIVGGIGAIASVYLNVRRREWKSAFATVVKTVEPFVPKDEEKRFMLKSQQGQAVTNLVKSVK